MVTLAPNPAKLSHIVSATYASFSSPSPQSNMVKSVRERVNLTADIRAIIDGYPSDNSLLREILQNSDDAGATAQVRITALTPSTPSLRAFRYSF